MPMIHADTGRPAAIGSFVAASLFATFGLTQDTIRVNGFALQSRITGGNPPDIFQIDDNFIAEYAARSVTLDLTSYAGDGRLDVSAPPAQGIRVLELSIDAISPNPHQPRRRGPIRCLASSTLTPSLIGDWE